jgi:hypothetical protein
MKRGIASPWIAGVGVMLWACASFATGSGPEPAGQRHDHPATRLEIDHVMIHVAPGAPERAALTRAGFTIAPGVNPHEGQGSASITVELANGFFELVWRDTGVSVAPGLEKVAQRFERMGQWRSSGWAPVGVGLRRNRTAPDSLPFATRPVRGPWMPPGASIEIISAASDTAGPRLWVVPRMMAANGVPESDSERRRLAQKATFLHSNHAHAITGVKITAPDLSLTPATALAAEFSPVTFAPGSSWLLEITFDGGRKGVSRDLRPDLPFLCHF